MDKKSSTCSEKRSTHFEDIFPDHFRLSPFADEDHVNPLKAQGELLSGPCSEI